MRGARLLPIGAVLGLALGVGACVEIATGPGGVESIRLIPVPPSIILGDTLRDSTGAVVRLRAVAFGARGDTVPDVPFRYTALALPRDTTAAQRAVPIVVDSVTGLVTARPTSATPRARIAVRISDRLQVIDTVTLVKRPTRLTRESADGVLSMGFLCSADTAHAAAPVRIAVGPTVSADSANVGSAQPIAVTLTADSTGTLRSPVPSYFVHFEIVSPTNIPTTQYRGVTRPAISIISDLNTDRPTDTDTTESAGTATAYLRVLATGLGPSAFPTDTFSVHVRASARTSPKDIVPSPIDFVIKLRRVSSLPASGALTGPGCR